MEERYARQTMLPEIGERGQRRLSEASVLIVGIGGLGSAAALYLTGAGVGRIGLADADTVSKSNLQRQVLYTEGQVGMPKSAAARERLAALRPTPRSNVGRRNYSGKRTAYSGRLRPDTRLLRQLSDPLPARRCMRCLPKTLGTRLDRGVLRSGDRFQRSERPSLQRSLSRPGGPLCPSRITQGVLGTVPGVIGTLQASEAIKYLCGFGEPLDGRLFTIDLRTLQTQIIDY